MKVTVIGCGRWGSCIGWYLDKIGQDVSLYGPIETPDMERFTRERTNGIITLRDSVSLIYDLDTALKCDITVISINSQGLRSLCAEINQAYSRDANLCRTFILCMKGIEIETGMRLSEVMADCIPDSKVAVWIGPGHPQEFVRGIPNCMVIDSNDPTLKRTLVDTFTGDVIRFYYGNDLIGNEIGAAAKNVIGIAAGMLDGYGLSSLKGALMSRGTHEVARLIRAMGGNELSAYGLCHLGDYEATVFSKYSHNRMFGETYVKGESYTALAEGYYTAAAIHNMCKKNGVDMPICEAVYSILYDKQDPKTVLNNLFSRSIKNELA